MDKAKYPGSQKKTTKVAIGETSSRNSRPVKVHYNFMVFQRCENTNKTSQNDLGLWCKKTSVKLDLHNKLQLGMDRNEK